MQSPHSPSHSPASEERVRVLRRREMTVNRIRELYYDFFKLPYNWVFNFIWCLTLPQEIFNGATDNHLRVMRRIVKDRQHVLTAFDFSLFTEIIEEKSLTALITFLPDLESIKIYNVLGKNNNNLLLHLQKLKNLKNLFLSFGPEDSFKRACLNIKTVTLHSQRRKTHIQPTFDFMYSLQSCKSLNFSDGYISKMTMHLIKDLPLVELNIYDTIFEIEVASELFMKILSNTKLRILGLISTINDIASVALQKLIGSFMIIIMAKPLNIEELTLSLTTDAIELNNITYLPRLKKLSIHFGEGVNNKSLDNLLTVLPKLEHVEIDLIQFRYKENIESTCNTDVNIKRYIELYRLCGPHVNVFTLPE